MNIAGMKNKIIECKIVFIRPGVNIPLGKSRGRSRKHADIKVNLKGHEMNFRLNATGSV